MIVKKLVLIMELCSIVYANVYLDVFVGKVIWEMDLENVLLLINAVSVQFIWDHL